MRCLAVSLATWGFLEIQKFEELPDLGKMGYHLPERFEMVGQRDRLSATL